VECLLTKKGNAMKSVQQKYDEATARNVQNMTKQKYGNKDVEKGLVYTTAQAKHALGIRQNDTKYDAKINAVVGGAK
jgi:hypothetical protein